MLDRPATLSRRDALRATLVPLAAAALTMGAANGAMAQGAGANGRVIVYLSRSGNTRVLAGALARRFDADLFEVRTRDPWPADYNEMVAWSRQLRSSETDVPLAEMLDQIGQYHTVFLGFPIWNTDLPAVMRTFLRAHDLTGKTIMPFITYGSSGVGSAIETARQAAPGATFLDAFSILCDQERTTLETLDQYLEGVPVPS